MKQSRLELELIASGKKIGIGQWRYKKWHGFISAEWSKG